MHPNNPNPSTYDIQAEDEADYLTSKGFEVANQHIRNGEFDEVTIATAIRLAECPHLIEWLKNPGFVSSDEALADVWSALQDFLVHEYIRGFI